MRILHAICEQERSVSQIVAETGATQTNVSRHLNAMYRAGALMRRKEGNFTFYSVRDSALTEICRTVCAHITERSGALEKERSAMTLFVREDAGPQRSSRARASAPAARRRATRR